MTNNGRLFPRFLVFLSMIFLIGSMIATPVLADEPFATPITEPIAPTAEVVPPDTGERVQSVPASDEPAAPDEGPPAEPTPTTEAARSMANTEVMAAIEPLTTTYLTITESTGRTIAFPDGQTACFSILLDPPAAHGSPYTVYCISEIDGVAEIFGGMPDVHVTAYSVDVWSNTTACDFWVGEPVVAELGSGLSRVDIAIEATCPDDLTDPPGPFDGIGMEVSDSTGMDRTYPGEICLEFVTTPELTGPPIGPFCVSESYSVAITNREGDIFPRDTVYDAVVLSNATGCTPTWSFREAFVPPGVLVVGLISVVLTCDEDPAPAADFDAVAFSLSDASGTGRTYPGEICLAIQITPAVTVPGMETLCYSESAAAFGWDAAGAILPRTSSYEGVVVSNTTGCTPSWSFREVLSVDGPLIAVVDFVLTCDASASDSYVGVGVTLTDSTGVDRTYDGEICVDVAITPAVTIPGAMPQCFTSSHAQSGYPANGAILPRDSTYEGVIVSNTTGCDATWTTREMTIPPSEPVEHDFVLVDDRDVIPADPPPSSSTGGVMIVVDVVITCDDDPAEEPPYKVGIAISDDRGGDFTYPGDVCVEFGIDPVIGDSTTSTHCTSSTFTYLLFPDDGTILLPTSTYTLSLVSNATGCDVSIDPFQTTAPLGAPMGHFEVRVNCDDTGEKPEPSVTATATATPTATGTATLEASPTSTAMATETPGVGETPVATVSPVSLTPTAGVTPSPPSETQDVGSGPGTTAVGSVTCRQSPNHGNGRRWNRPAFHRPHDPGRHVAACGCRRWDRAAKGLARWLSGTHRA